VRSAGPFSFPETFPDKQFRIGAMAKRRGAAAESALLPLDYMLQVLRDPEASAAERKWAAEKAAPYLHARRQSVEQGGEAALSHEDALEQLK